MTGEIPKGNDMEKAGGEEYRPRHAVPEIYQEMLDTFGDPNRPDDRPYIPKHRKPEDDPYSTAYLIPITDFENPDADVGPVPPWSPPIVEEPVAREEEGPPGSLLLWPPAPEEPEAEEVEYPDAPFLVPSPRETPLFEPEPAPEASELPSFAFRHRVPAGRRPRRIVNFDDEPDMPPEPPPENPPPPVPPSAVPLQRKGESRLGQLRDAYYLGLAAIKAFFTDPERVRRRKLIARRAVLVGAVAAAGLAVLLGPDLIHHRPDVPHVTQPAGPPPNTEQFFDTIQPGAIYHGEPYEWNAAANHIGPAQATPELQRLVHLARSNGLRVDAWGDPACGDWGIDSVTVKLPNGTHKSYYDTPRKLAILQWYAGGMGPQRG